MRKYECIEDDDGTVTERYWQGATLHRDGQPALIERYADGARMIVYFRYGTMHRTDGPAWARYRADGSIQDAVY